MSKKIINHLSKDLVMARLIKKFPNVFPEWEKRKKKRRDIFTSIARTIVGQQLSVKAASTIWGRVEKLVGKMTPKNVLKHEDKKYREVGMSWAKASYLIGLASDVKNKKIILEDLHNLNEEEAREKLIELKGIGPWSAEMIMMFTLNKTDMFSIGDMGLKNAISRAYKVDKKNEKKIIKIAQNWSPYRTVACIYLWESLDNVPK